MKRLFSASILLLLLAAAVASMNSCIRPDLSDCPKQNVRIVVKTYPEATRATDTDRYNIENVTIYVFDENYKFVTAWQGDAYAHGCVYEAYLDIAPGQYHFVVWTNQGQTYTTTHTIDDLHGQTPQIEDLTLYMNCPADGKIATDLQDLHHGMLSDATVYENTLNEFTVVLTPNTYRINVTVKGLTADENRYGFTITDNNSHYTFDNRIMDGQSDFKHTRYAKFEGADDLSASMTVLKLTHDRSPYFDFFNDTNQQNLFSDDLVAMIKRAYDKKATPTNYEELFATVFEYNIVIKYDALMDMTISINGWEYSNNETEL